MIDVVFPEPLFRTRIADGRQHIFDPIRKKWLRLSPEEWVRQNFVNYLITSMSYPAAMIALEKEILLGEMKKRFDILVYNTDHQPWMMIECKEPEVPLSQDVLNQLLRYNIKVPVKYMIITNGNQTFGWVKEDIHLKLIDQLPAFGK